MALVILDMVLSQLNFLRQISVLQFQGDLREGGERDGETEREGEGGRQEVDTS